SSLLATPTSRSRDLHNRAYDALRLVFPAAGSSTDYGRCLPLDFRAAGLVDVAAEGRVHVGLGGTPAASWWQLTMSKLCEPLVNTGRLTETELLEVVESCDEEDFCVLYPTLVSVWGRRPA
ncbi:MAG TPA: hypothetical protein VHL53_15385, partial [Acidimicrobiia bacterium]|nr:hypothetical protein [Acidimicrobiia bacterium]